MNRWMWAVVTMSFVALALVAAPAKDKRAEAEAILDRAIKAVGGEEKLNRLNAFVVKIREKNPVPDSPIESDMILSYEAPDKLRIEYDTDTDGKPQGGVQIFNGNQGWDVSNNKAHDLPKEYIAQTQTEPFFHFLVRRLPLLKGKEYKLLVVGDAKVEEKTATVLLVSRAGTWDVKLFFDKNSALLLKQEFEFSPDTLSGAPQRPVMDDPERIKVEILYEDYKVSGGIKYPSKSTRTQSGRTTVEEITEFKVVEKFDEKTFARPE